MLGLSSIVIKLKATIAKMVVVVVVVGGGGCGWLILFIISFFGFF